MPRKGYLIFKDYSSQLEYVRPCEEIWSKGMYVELGAYQCHAFMDFRFAYDSEWGTICEKLNGAGVPSLQEEWRRTFAAVDEVIEEVPAKKKRAARKPVKKTAAKSKSVKKTATKKTVVKPKAKVVKKTTAAKKPVKKVVAKKTTTAKPKASKKSNVTKKTAKATKPAAKKVTTKKAVAKPVAKKTVSKKKSK